MSGGGPIARGAGARPGTAARAIGAVLVLSGLLLFGLLFPAPGASGAAASQAGPTTRPAAAVPAVSALPGDSTTPGWTTFHGSENRSGSTPFSGPTSGALLWARQETAFPIRAGPLSSGDRIYVADVLGHVAAVNRTTNGTVVWRANVSVSPTTPDLSGSNLYLGDGSGNVTDLRASNGTLLWRQSVGAPVLQGVAAANGSVLVGTTAGRVVALNGSTGSVEWTATVPGSISGALAWEGSSAYVANLSGGVFRVDSGGGLAWRADVASTVTTSVAVYGGQVVVVDNGGNVTALSAVDGSLRWRFHDPSAGDSFNATAAVADGLVVVLSTLGHDFALYSSNGTLRWERTVSLVGYSVLAGPVLAPNGVYAIDAGEQLSDLDLGTGAPNWVASTGSSYSFSGPTVDQGQVIVGDEVGFLFDFGLNAAAQRYPVSGTVVNPSGAPVAAATVSGPGTSTTTNVTGGFLLRLANGSFQLNVSGVGYPPTLFPINVSGPRSGLLLLIRPLTVWPMRGEVVDGYSAQPLAGLNVTVFGPWGYVAHNRSSADGTFVLPVPNGSDFFTVDPPVGYSGLSERVVIALNASSDGSFRLVLGMPPTVLTPPSSDPYHSVLLIAAIAAAAAVLVAGLGYRARRKAQENLSRSILTPFERFLLMRSALIVPQIVAILVILYVFGTFLPAAALNQPPCSILGVNSACAGCTWSNVLCVVTVFGWGLVVFLWNLFTGNWGIASYGNLRAPASDFVQWWGPYTIELALITLLLAALIAYPLGLWAGWRTERPVDTGTRVLSIAALLVPSFLVVLLLLGVAYVPFLNTVGDTPYGIIPTATWFSANGGQPLWIGDAANTSPTGFPLVDGAIHQDWSFEAITLAKTLLQAFLIAVVYIAIFLRFARHTVAEAVAEPHVQAARVRGVPESRLLWHHTSRRVLPIFVLILGLTIPIYLGTQALVEALFNDPGLGTLLLAQMTNVQVTRFGYSSLNGVHPGNIYQVAVFFTALVVLLASLCADVVARLLDPRLAAGERV